MSDVAMWISAVASGLVVLASIPYLICLLYTALKKRWRGFAILICVPLFLFLILGGTIRILNHSAHRDYLADIYDTEVDFADPIFEYYSNRHFNGDGYSIEVMELPDSIRRRFDSADARLFTEFPIRPSYREDWEIRL